MPERFPPAREADLVAESANFCSKVAATPAVYGIDPARASDLAELNTDFAQAYAVARDPATRTKLAIVNKDEAKAALLKALREVAGMIQANPDVTDAMRSGLGLPIHKSEPTPVPVPQQEPEQDVHDRNGWTVRLRLHDGTIRRGCPEGVAGATVFSYVGEEPPSADMAAWKFVCNTRRTLVDVTFDTTLAPGTKVWFTSCWYNARGATGPRAVPLSTTLAGGALPQAA